MAYPSKVRIKDKVYPINTDWRVGVKCLEVSEDPDISDEERSMAIIYLLFGFVPDADIEEFLEAARKYLSCGEPQEEHQKRKKDMDFTQDEKYIAASFMSDYKIDLSTSDMHFWQFFALICGLTEHSVLSRIRELRNYDLSELKDPKARNKMADAQEAVALKHKTTKAEQEMIDEFEKLMGKEG